VIDSNQLQSERLARFLRESPTSAAVLPDFVAMEAHKGNFLKSMSVLSQFPKQVLVLKSSKSIARLSGRGKGLQQRLIDSSVTKEFSILVEALRLAEAGDPRVLAQLEDRRIRARAHFEKMDTGVESIRESLSELGDQYSKEEQAALRSGHFTPEVLDKLVRMVLALSVMLFGDPSLERKPPPFAELLNTYIFRVTLASYLVVIKGVADGGVERTSTGKLRNDFIDMALVAYGTFFDGVMSSDAKLNEMSREVSVVLAALRAR